MSKDLKPSNPIPVDWLLKIGCLAILIYWSVLLVQPFLTIIVWSIILAVVLYPIFDRTVLGLRLHRTVAATSITVFSLLIVLGPATWLGISLITSLQSIVDKVNAGSISIPPPSESIKHWPLVWRRLL